MLQLDVWGSSVRSFEQLTTEDKMVYSLNAQQNDNNGGH